jgi:hypothetical protein
LVSVFDLLVWAFRDECAQIEFDQIASVSDERPGIDPLQRLIDSAALGCRIDGGGRSDPHPDADAVAQALSVLPIGCGGARMALNIAEHAKIGSTPDWMRDVAPRFYPAAWVENQFGRLAGTVDASDLSNGFPATQRRNRKGRLVEERAKVCPVYVSPTAQEVSARRREYILWWGALLEIKTNFQIYNNLTAFEVSDVMPVMRPWAK